MLSMLLEGLVKSMEITAPGDQHKGTRSDVFSSDLF